MEVERGVKRGGMGMREDEEKDTEGGMRGGRKGEGKGGEG